MTTATTIVNDSLRLCNEFSGILPVDPKIQQQGFERLADMLNTMRGDHLYVTPQIPAAIGDDFDGGPFGQSVSGPSGQQDSCCGIESR